MFSTYIETSNIIHVRLREPAPGQEQDSYFGSMLAIFDILPETAIGVKYDTLCNCFAKRDYPYENPKCIIKRGTIVRKKKSKNKK